SPSQSPVGQSQLRRLRARDQRAAVKAEAFTDGGGNTGTQGSCACVLYLEDGRRRESYRRLGEVSNNIAEYQGVLLAMDYADGFGVTELVINSDSKLIVNQLQGRYKVNHSHLRELRDACWNF